jgi:hypothetical protein
MAVSFEIWEVKIDESGRWCVNFCAVLEEGKENVLKEVREMCIKGSRCEFVQWIFRGNSTINLSLVIIPYEFKRKAHTLIYRKGRRERSEGKKSRK